DNNTTSNDNTTPSPLNSPFRTNLTTTNFFFDKRCFSAINNNNQLHQTPINDSTHTNTTESFLSCHIDSMFPCPEVDCFKRYPSIIALRYHLGYAHAKGDWDLNNDDLPQKLEPVADKKECTATLSSKVTAEEISNSAILEEEKVTTDNKADGATTATKCDDKTIDIKIETTIEQEYPLISLLDNIDNKDNELIDQKHSTHEEDVAHILANVADYVRSSTTNTPAPSSITSNQSEQSRSPPLISIIPPACTINRVSSPLLSSISPSTSLPQTILSWPSPQSKMILSSPMTSVLSETPSLQNSTNNSLSSPPLSTKPVSIISNNNNNSRYNEHTTSLKTDNNRLINSRKSPLLFSELQKQQVTTAVTVYPPKVTLDDINQIPNSKQENYRKLSLVSASLPKPIFPTTSYLSLSENNSHHTSSEYEKSFKTNTLKYADHVLLPIKEEAYNPLTVTTLQQPRPSPSPTTISPLHNKMLSNGSTALVSPPPQQYLSPRSLNNGNIPYLFTESKPSSNSIYQNLVNNNSLWTTSTNVKERKKKRKLKDEEHSTLLTNNNHSKMNPTLFGPTSPLMSTTSSNSSSSCSSTSSSSHPVSNPLNLSSTQIISQSQPKQQINYPPPSSPAYSDISDENDNENTDEMKKNNSNTLNNSITTNLLTQTLPSKTTPTIIKAIDEENMINNTLK
ncbi:unnamed protein product, partial [Didymodactylos carnosus]